MAEGHTGRLGFRSRRSAAGNGDASWMIEPMPEGLEDSPLDFLFADHHRQRQAVQILLRIAGGEHDETALRNLITFLERDFALHIADEERDFVPLLRRQCRPEDNIDRLIERLSLEHADDESSVREIVAILRSRLQGVVLSEWDQARMRDFASHLRRHLALENGVLLPIARVRMGAASLALLAARIRERRARRRS